MNSRPDIARATELLDAGKAYDSMAICAGILASEPKNAVAAHLLGLALKESGDFVQAEQWLRLSIRLEPGRPEFHANLGNLLRRQSKFFRAERVYRRALSLAPGYRPARHSLALTLNDLERFAEAEIECRTLLAGEESDAEAWVLLALTLESQGRLGETETALRRAIELDPDNPIAHHNLGALLSRMEKPESAVLALDRARALGAGSFELAFNRARAFLELNDLEAAEREFDQAVALRPGSIDAQAHLARIRFMRGDPQFARAVATASAANRDDIELQTLFGELLWRAGNLLSAESVMHDVLSRGGTNPSAQATLAGILLDQGMLKEAEAQAMEAATAAPSDSTIVETLVTIMLSRGCAADAVGFIDAQRRRFPDSQAWIAYEATAARALGRESYTKLYDYDRLIQTFEIEAPPGWSSIAALNRDLLTALDERHRFTQRPLDQTLRNGTQTSRSLLSDAHPAIRAILQAFQAPIAHYRRVLGCDANQPLSARNAGEAVYTGAWSVRLRRDGYHVNHFHPDGWLSSAYYVDVPPETKDAAAKPGWIKFGEPRYPVPGLQAERFVQPRPGRLVLFPSYMWHGTNAISTDQARVSIAFDVKPTKTGV